MLNKKIVAAALLLATAGAAHAEAPAQANVKWLGFVDSVTEGELLTITGEGGGEVANGVLSINSDGTFTSTSVVVEAHDWDGSDVGSINTGAQWSVANISYVADGDIVDPSNIVLTDLYTGTALVDATTALGTQGVITAGALNLQLSNDVPTGSDVLDNGTVQVSMTAQLTL